MTTVRNLGAVPLATIQSNEIETRYAVRLDLPDASILRLTDRVGGFTATVDGGSATWTETDLQVGPIPQSRNDVMTVSWVKFGNLDYAWTNRAYSPGLRSSKCQVWACWWDGPLPTATFKGSYPLFGGKVDDQLIEQTATLTLIPFVPTWAKPIPATRAGVTCVNRYKGVRCQYAGAEPTGETTCNKTRADCVLRSNTVHFNGCDHLPPPGTTVTWGGLHIQVGGNPGPGGGDLDISDITGNARTVILPPPRPRPPVVVTR
jgi:hypothetical protein